ncbi:MAG: hypothetical protein JHC99_07015 [Brevundimonas sp.]|nr:hypothetical protein [Brevundimonas sp.]
MDEAIGDAPFDRDMLAAIACQETGYIWSVLRRKGLGTDEILRLCVGDTLDADRGRKAFPKTYEDLIEAPNGAAMFKVARQALVDMAAHIPGYATVAKRRHKFCHGYGVFQYDLQFFKDHPDYFLNRDYSDFRKSAERCVTELRRGLVTLGYQERRILTDLEMARVAIAYNTGGFKPALGLKQGHKGDDGVFYGEAFYAFLLKCRTVTPPAEPAPGKALSPRPTPVDAGGLQYQVDTREGLLNVRRTPSKDPAHPWANFIIGLPDGHVVSAVTGTPVTGYLEIETSLAGAHVRGFASTDYLVRLKAKSEVKAEPAPFAPVGLTAVIMPRKPGTITKRTAPAGAHSLNEPGAPGRAGATPVALCAELGAIIGWLGVETPAHLRYQPHDGLTFCNIYAHDYCHLAGAYLPRVWWTPGALVSIAQGRTVLPLYGNTIEEVRANGLFRWLRDFGPFFGWRQTGDLDKLQEHANQGGIGLIVARRKEDGRSGHIVAVVPETEKNRAVRGSTGVVRAPLQSQAGARNAAYVAKVDWWLGDQFAESGFWIHD